MSSAVFDAVISLVDEGSQTILNLERHLLGLGNASELADAELKKTGRTAIEVGAEMKLSSHEALWAQMEAGAGLAREKVLGLGEGFRWLGRHVGEVLPMLAGIGAVTSVAGVVDLVERTSEAALNLQHMAITAGMTTQEFQKLSYAGQQVGVPVDDVATAMGRLNQRLGQAAVGQMKPLTELFRHFGIVTRDVHGHLLNAAEVLPQLENLFGHLKPGPAANFIGFELFGRSYQAILPLLDMGNQKLSEADERFKKFGYTFSNDQLASLKEFGDSWENLKTASEGFLDDVGVHLSPVLTPVINKMAAWLGLNKDWIATDTAGSVKGISDAVEGLNPAFAAAERAAKAFEPPAIAAWKGFKDNMAVLWHGMKYDFEYYHDAVMVGLNEIKNFTGGFTPQGPQQARNSMDSVVAAANASDNPLVKRQGTPVYEQSPSQQDLGGDWWYANVIQPILDTSVRGPGENPGRYFNQANPNVLEVKVDFTNVPPGATVSTKTSGDSVQPPRVRLGYNSMMTGHN